MRIADIRKREEQRAQDRAGFGFEAKFVHDILGDAILVVIDVDGVKNLVVEVEIVGTVGRILARIYIHDERHAPIG